MHWPFRLSDHLVLILLLAVALGAQQPATTAAAPDQRAQQVLAQVRAAAGNAAALQNLRSLEVDLVQHRIAPPLPGQTALVTPELETPVTLQFQLPQGFRKTVQPPPPIGVSRSLQLTQTVNGNTFWVQGEGQGGPGNVFYFRRQPVPPDPEGPQPQAAPAGPPMGPRRFHRQLPFAGPAQRLQNEATRDLLMLAPGSPASSKLHWTYVGTAAEPNGAADVLDATGPNGFAARLYFDQQTHRLVMMSWPGAGAPPQMLFHMRPERFRMRDGRGPEPPMSPISPMAQGFRPGPAGHAPAGPRWQEMRIIGRPLGGGQPLGRRPLHAGMDLHFSDYRAENGVRMPHRIVVTDHGRPVEEWIIHAVKWNPAFPASTFEQPSHAPAPK